MLSYISPSSSAAPSPRSCVSPSPLAHKLNVIGSPLALSPHGSPSFRGIVHPVTPPPFTLASDKPSTTGKSATTGLGAGGHPTALGRQYSTLGAPSGLGGAHVSKSMSTYGSFDYEAEGSNYPAKRMDSVHEALKELHEILMGDVGSSESSSDSGEDAGEGAFEMDDDDEDEARDEVKLPVSPPSVGIMSGRRASLMAAQRPREKPSKGWRKGVARESVRFQLMVDVPCWEPGCYSDLSSMQALRDKTLKALHNLIDSLHLRGIRSTYRLHSTANGGAWGCIRVAPFMSSRLGPSASSSYHKAPTSPLSSFSPVTPSSLLLNAQTRRSTVAGSLPTTSSSWSGDGKAAMLEKKEMDEKERVAERIKKALEEDGEGIVEENRTYLLAVNGQPALILT